MRALFIVSELSSTEVYRGGVEREAKIEDVSQEQANERTEAGR